MNVPLITNHDDVDDDDEDVDVDDDNDDIEKITEDWNYYFECY